MADKSDVVPELIHAIVAVEDAIGMVEAALHDNPSKSHERALNRNLLRLNAERAVLEAELDAALSDSTSVEVRGPTAEQLVEIVRLTAEIEEASRTFSSTATKLKLALRALESAKVFEIVGPWPPR